MECERANEALSARLDGEPLPAGVDPADVDGHLQRCRACRAWLSDAEALKRMFTLRPAPELPGIGPAIAAGFVSAAHHHRTTRRRTAVLRAAIVAVAALQIAVGAPVLLWGHDRQAPIHVAHEMGSFELAVALGLLAAAQRPSRALGMAWLMAAMSMILTVTAVVDLARQATTFSDEAPHLLVLAGTALLVALARRPLPTLRPGTAAVSGPEPIRTDRLGGRHFLNLHGGPGQPHRPHTPAARAGRDRRRDRDRAA